MTTTSFPLSWPVAWPRTPSVQRSYRTPFKGTTFARGRDRLATELERLGARDCMLSTNVPLRLDGQPRGDFAFTSLSDPGVAVYFTLKGKPMVMARDEYRGIAENITSLALAIEYLRGLHRHGGAVTMERAFSGFVALPAPTADTCWDVLGMDGEPTGNPIDKRAHIATAYRKAALKAHPDHGGTADRMTKLVMAKDEALRLVGI